MAVNVLDNRITFSDAESITDWSTDNIGSTTPTLDIFSADPYPIQGTFCLGMPVNIQIAAIFYTSAASVDLSNDLVYVWLLPNGIMDTLANGGTGIVLGDGTNLVGFHLGGSDIAGFRYDERLPTWQCLVLDTSQLPTTYYSEYAGTWAALSANLNAITQIGAQFACVAKALGGTDNCFVDAIRIGNGGLTITSGSSGDPGTMEEVYQSDNSVTNAFGVVRKVGAGVYSVQGPLQFGTAATSSTYFYDTNSTILFEERLIGDDKYNITIEGNATSATYFQLGDKVGTGDTAGGAGGYVVQAPADIGTLFIATGTNIDEMYVYGSTFAQLSGGIVLGSGGDSSAHEWIGNNVQGCGQVYTGRVQTRGSTFGGTVDIFSGISANGAALLWNPNINISYCTFAGNDGGNPGAAPSGHGIQHDLSGTFPYTNMLFADNDYDILNASSGDVTINATDSDPGTYENIPSSGQTFIVNTVNLEVYGVETGIEPADYVRCYIEAAAGGSLSAGTILLSDYASAADGFGTYKATSAFNYAGAQPVIVRARYAGYIPFVANATIDDTGLSVAAQWVVDPFANV